ncbi:hypothetical protein C2S51_022342 [Perilla frutescens var. frutescens]|nr:hypothetical protein C2S51_022342 [Perilla frutescens var. frutescens]
MTPQASTSTKLNPFAPEYNPIPPGITPSPHAPPPFVLSSPPSTAYRLPPSSPCLPPSLLLAHQILPYLPSTSHTTQQQFYPTTYSTYYVTSQNQVSTTLPPPQRPPPTTAVAAQYGQPGRELTTRGRGFRRGRDSSWRERDAKMRLKFERNCVGFSKHQQLSKRGMHKVENKHKIMPLNREEEKTTVMIKNIPYACPRKELMSMLDEFCLLGNRKAGNEGTSSRKEADEQLITYAYDFLYLPIDFRTKKSRGFAFVNFTNSRAAWEFFDSFHLKKWHYVERLNWPKKIEIVCAKIQGKEDLVSHFCESVFECETDEFLPLSFRPARDGSGKAVEVTVVGNRRPAGAPRWEPRGP